MLNDMTGDNVSKVQVDFLFDFGSPNAYLSHKVIPHVEARQEVVFRYVPILLGGLFKLTGNQSPADAFSHIKNKPQFAKLETARFVARHGITEYRYNPHFPINTLKLMRGAVAAQLDGTFDLYVTSVYRFMWEDELDMGDPAVLSAALDKAGLDGKGFAQRIDVPEVKQRLIDNTQEAFERGAFGSPTFFVNDEMYFGKDQLRDVEEEIIRLTAPRA
jgi:2-hydroxychromene-2-carboxylate isomerase